jgi:hypothetical protein
LATGPQDVKDPVQHLAYIHRTPPPAAFARRYHRLDNQPFAIAQITRVTKASAIGGTAVFRFPHQALPQQNQAPDKESHPIHPTQEVFGSALRDQQEDKIVGQTKRHRAIKPSSTASLPMPSGAEAALTYGIKAAAFEPPSFPHRLTLACWNVTPSEGVKRSAARGDELSLLVDQSPRGASSKSATSKSRVNPQALAEGLAPCSQQQIITIF